MKTSLALNDQELKQAIRDLEKTLLAKAIEWAREVYKVMLERLDCLIRRYRAKTLAIEHKRSTWYKTCLWPVRLTITQYRDADGGYHYLLDELLGMEIPSHHCKRARDSAGISGYHDLSQECRYITQNNSYRTISPDHTQVSTARC